MFKSPIRLLSFAGFSGVAILILLLTFWFPSRNFQLITKSTPRILDTSISTPQQVFDPFGSLLPTPAVTIMPPSTTEPQPEPSATPLPYEGISVAAVEPIKTGPYLDVHWSPDGKKALVSKNYVTHMLKLNQDAQNNSEVGVPLGVSIGLGDLWLVDLATNSERLLLEQVGRYTWAPKENKIAYISPTENEGIEGALYILDVDTGDTKELTKVNFLGSDYDPQWLPTDQIVFVSEGQVWSIDADGQQEPIRLHWEFLSWIAAENRSEKVEPKPDLIKQFQFSPIGNRIDYLIPHENERAIALQLWLANTDGTEPVLNTGQTIGYLWSPDGAQLAVLTYRGLDDPLLDEQLPPNRELWLVSADGKNKRMVYHFQGWGGPANVTWAPDNTKLLFLQLEFLEGGSLSTVWVADSAQDNKIGVLENVVEPHRHVNGLWWEPSGNTLIVTTESTENEQATISERVTFKR